MKSRIFPDNVSMFEAAAAEIAELSSRAAAGRGSFSLVLSGGSTPAGLFDLLSADFAGERRFAIPWERADVFQADERAVPPDDALSNYKMAFERLLSKVPIPERRIRKIKSELPPAEAAEEYDRVLREFRGARPEGEPMFDIVLLGFGLDGHTASIFPGGGLEDEMGRLAAAAPPPETVAPHVPRVTMTFAALNDSRKSLVLATGREKVELAERIWATNPDAAPPIAKVEAREGVDWFLAED